jgi:hypothetical protein
MTTQNHIFAADQQAGATAVHDALRQSAVLVQARTSSWIPTKRDNDLSADMANANAGDAAGFIGVKRLMTGNFARPFTNINSLLSTFRQRVLAITLPYGTGAARLEVGPRILANARFMDAQKLLVETQVRLDELVTEAVDNLAHAIQHARSTLGGAFKDSDYPSAEALRRMYAVDLTFSPVPDMGGFGQLPPDAMLVLGEKMAKDQNAVASNASRALTERATEYLDRLFDRIVECSKANNGDERYSGKGKRAPRVVSSLFDDAAELADFMEVYAPMMQNVPKISEAIARLRQLSQYEPDDFRDEARLLEANAVANAAYDCFEL